MKIIELITEAKKKTSFEFVKLKKAKQSLAEAAKESEKFPSSKDGILKFMNDPKQVRASFAKSLDLPNCDIHADSQVDGVWVVDSFKTGSRIIVYLGGYKDPSGQVFAPDGRHLATAPWLGQRRPFNDFEEGRLPMKTVRELLRRKKITLKDLDAWKKAGNIEAEDLVKLKKEFSED
jgi:hypothetical protein